MKTTKQNGKRLNLDHLVINMHQIQLHVLRNHADIVATHYYAIVQTNLFEIRYIW